MGELEVRRLAPQRTLQRQEPQHDVEVLVVVQGARLGDEPPGFARWRTRPSPEIDQVEPITGCQSLSTG
ncbi:MAG: hypothetical protein A2W29_10945 [Gemmatimonadetes bacterium RBG_16_66_8]|nr:MAG: hypothetical protein A2W29_10945 [Gemmatimonadetes bacterium RBG_16_66_8]